MNGDYSRYPFLRSSRWTSVLAQQGRLTLDADFNAQQQIVADRERSLVRELYGEHGGSESNAGFEVRPHPWIDLDGHGHFVVDALGLPSPEMTVSIWIRSGRGGPVVAGPGWHVDVDERGQVEARVDDAIVTTPIEPGTPVLLTLTTDASSISLFIDGERVCAARRTLSTAARHAVHVGGRDGRHFHGGLTALAWWSRQLDASSVRRLAQQPGRRAGALAWLPFDRRIPFTNDYLGWPLECTARFRGTAAPRQQSQLWLTGGRYHVRGYTAVNDVAKPLPMPVEAGEFHASLHTWVEARIWQQEPTLREAALGSRSPTARLERLFEVRIEPDATPPAPPALATVQRNRSAELLGNQLYRLQIQSTGSLHDEPTPGIPAKFSANCLELASDPGWAPGQALVLEATDNHTDKGAPCFAVVQRVWSDSKVQVLVEEPAAQARQVDVRPIAAARWDPDNGSVTFAIVPPTEPGGTQLDLAPAATAEPGPVKGDIVELVGPRDRDPGPLFRVADVTGNGSTVTVDGALPAIEKNTILRRWSRTKTSASATIGIVPIGTSRTIWIELGLSMTFIDPNWLRPGDSWMFTVRADGTVQWPRVDGQAVPMPPATRQAASAPLARLYCDGASCWTEDRRRLFGPLPRAGVLSSVLAAAPPGPDWRATGFEVEATARTEQWATATTLQTTTACIASAGSTLVLFDWGRSRMSVYAKGQWRDAGGIPPEARGGHATSGPRNISVLVGEGGNRKLWFIDGADLDWEEAPAPTAGVPVAIGDAWLAVGAGRVQVLDGDTWTDGPQLQSPVTPTAVASGTSRATVFTDEGLWHLTRQTDGTIAAAAASAPPGVIGATRHDGTLFAMTAHDSNVYQLDDATWSSDSKLVFSHTDLHLASDGKTLHALARSTSGRWNHMKKTRKTTVQVYERDFSDPNLTP